MNFEDFRPFSSRGKFKAALKSAEFPESPEFPEFPELFGEFSGIRSNFLALAQFSWISGIGVGIFV